MTSEQAGAEAVDGNAAGTGIGEVAGDGQPDTVGGTSDDRGCAVELLGQGELPQVAARVT